MRKYVKNIGLLMTCGVFLTLSACSDNKSQETTATPKVVEQKASTKSPTASPSAPEQSSSAGDGGACDTLLTTKCTECHNTNRICEKLGKKSKSRWQRTITRMTERGLKLTTEEADAILTCLDSGSENLQAVCH